MSWCKALPFLFLAQSASAFEGFVVGGGVEADNEDGLAAALVGDLGLTEKTWLSASLAKNRVELPRSITLNTTYADIGIDHHFDPVGIAVDAAYWGDSDLLDSRDLRASLYWRNDRFSISADYEHRDLEFDIPSTDLLRVRTVSFDADGVGLNAQYRLTDALSVNAMGIDYDYSLRLERVDNRDIAALLSVSRLSLINSLVDYRAGVGVGLDVGERHWSLDYRTWQLAVDGSTTNSYTLRFLTPMGRRGDLELGIGVDDSNLYGSVTFFSVFLYFYGGR